jgi:hypothetical protein
MPPGYAIEISRDELDAAQFETLTREAGAAVRAGEWVRAGRTASQALGLWRGMPLADVPSQTLRDRWVPHLDQLHVQSLEWRIEADLHEGRYEELIPELRDLTASHPLRERFHGQLMLALYQCGRQAEALAAYSRARDALISELGVEPGPGLRDLHQQVLDAAPVLAAASPTRPPVAEPVQVTPRDLPPTVPDFTGRSAELQTLTGLLNRPGQQVPGAHRQAPRQARQHEGVGGLMETAPPRTGLGIRRDCTPMTLTCASGSGSLLAWHRQVRTRWVRNMAYRRQGW